MLSTDGCPPQLKVSIEHVRTNENSDFARTYDVLRLVCTYEKKFDGQTYVQIRLSGGMMLISSFSRFGQDARASILTCFRLDIRLYNVLYGIPSCKLWRPGQIPSSHKLEKFLSSISGIMEPYRDKFMLIFFRSDHQIIEKVQCQELSCDNMKNHKQI